MIRMKFLSLKICALLVCLVLFASFYTSQDLPKSIQRGKEVYTTYCMTCHMEDGKGLGDINPPLAKTDYIRKPAKILIDIILSGQSGEILVNNKKYNTMMPPQPYLSDEQIADVLNYVRNSWGNKVAGIIKPGQVKSLRK